MSESPFFSVIIPCYNRGHLITETIRSVLAQTETDFEIIVIDDGSTDDTKNVVQSISDSRIHYYYQENAERGAARNKGVRESGGRYITFLDSDDRFFPHHLRIVKEKLSAHAASFYFQPYCWITTDGKVQKKISPLQGDLNLKLVQDGNFMSCHGVFLKRTLALANPFNEDRALSGSEDYELWLRIASREVLVMGKEITSALILHDERSVFNFDSDQLIKRKEKMISYLRHDESFMNRFGRYFHYVESGAFSYVALHLPLNRKTRNKRIYYWWRAAQNRPLFLFSRRSMVILRQIFWGY